MGLEKLVDEVRRTAEAEALDIMERSKAESGGIIANAETEARSIVAQNRRESREEAMKENREELSRARNEASRVLDTARAQVVDRHLQAVWVRVLQFRETDGYGSMMRSLVSRANNELGKGARIYCRKEDAGLIAPDKPQGFIACEGGILVEDSTGRVKLDGRMESLFAESGDKLSAVIYSHVFQGGR